ncbi:MAG: triose-phosphate isomerase [Thermoanaerobaculia bacterium]
MNAARRPLVGGNWKMHLLPEEATGYCRVFGPAVADAGPEVVLFPSFPLLPAVAAALAGSPVACGGQDLHTADSGAHTGDVSGGQLAAVGCRWVLCGHSERRHDHGESDELVGAKALAARRHGLMPLVCVGETKQERTAGRTEEVLARQLTAALADGVDRFELAYEPVWAIGTGETATPETAQEAHAFLRAALGDLRGEETAAACRILYGGSVKPANAAELAARPDLDGFLVGGASLDAESFLAIIRVCGSS